MAEKERRASKTNKKTLPDDTAMRIKNLEYLYDSRALEDGAKRVFEIDKQNMELLKNLNLIMRTKGKTLSSQLKVTAENGTEEKKAKKIKIATVNKQLHDRIRTSVGRYSASTMENDWKKNRLSSENKLKSSLLENGDATSTSRHSSKSLKARHVAVLRGPKMNELPRCFFEFQVMDPIRKLGKVIFELYPKIVPKTCENFISFCMGFNGLSYRNTPLHRIISGYLCQGGDVTKFNGSGSTSIYGDVFEDENFELKHTAAGILSMWNNGKNTNNSKFNLTFKKLEVLDGKNVVFGKVIIGLPIIYKIDALGTQIGRPKKKIIISECGLC